MSVIPCYRGGHHCSFPACAMDCDGRPGNEKDDIVSSDIKRKTRFPGGDPFKRGYMSVEIKVTDVYGISNTYTLGKVENVTYTPPPAFAESHADRDLHTIKIEVSRQVEYNQVEYKFNLRDLNADLQSADEAPRTDTERLDWLERQLATSQTGISFDKIPAVEGEPSGVRFMKRKFIGDPKPTLRASIDYVMNLAKALS